MKQEWNWLKSINEIDNGKESGQGENEVERNKPFIGRFSSIVAVRIKERHSLKLWVVIGW